MVTKTKRALKRFSVTTRGAGGRLAAESAIRASKLLRQQWTVATASNAAVSSAKTKKSATRAKKS